MPLATVSLYEVILAIHIMAVVIAFGVVFAYPMMFAVAARHEPRSLPLLHRVEYTVERWLVNPALLVVFAAGIFLASDGHWWKSFFVQWGFAAVIVIGGVVGAVMIPTSKKAAEVAQRDVDASLSAAGIVSASSGSGGASAGGAGAGQAGTVSDAEIAMSDEYRGLVRRLGLAGSGLSLLVLVTIFFMALKL